MAKHGHLCSPCLLLFFSDHFSFFTRSKLTKLPDQRRRPIPRGPRTRCRDGGGHSALWTPRRLFAHTAVYGKVFIRLPVLSRKTFSFLHSYIGNVNEHTSIRGNYIRCTPVGISNDHGSRFVLFTFFYSRKNTFVLYVCMIQKISENNKIICFCFLKRQYV